jgi:hypothetical protein
MINNVLEWKRFDFMKQKYKNIKTSKEFCYKQIEEANKTLEEIREQCDHPEEYNEKCTYSPRVGQYWDNTIICSICGAVISFSENI